MTNANNPNFLSKTDPTALRPAPAARSHRVSLRLDPRSFPIALPHAFCADNTLFFGHRAMAEVSAVESNLLASCDGTRSLKELLDLFHCDAHAVTRIAPWLLWWDRPVPHTIDCLQRMDRVVFSTTPEGAWTGMGGRLLGSSPEEPTLITNCFGSVSEGCQPLAFPTPEQASFAARDELALAAILTGASSESWAVPDRELRLRDFPRLSGDSVGLGSLLRGLVKTLLRRTRPSIVFAPLPGDPDSDASCLLQVLLNLYVAGDLDAEIHLYEERPAVVGERIIDEFLARFENCYLTASPYVHEMSPCIARKASLLELFRSRLDRAQRALWEQSQVRNARWNGDGKTCCAERFWAVRLGMEA